MSDTEPKKAVVTGASRGIGRAIALALGAQGVEVYGTATSEQGAAAVAEMLQQAQIKGGGLMPELCRYPGQQCGNHPRRPADAHG